MLLDARSVAENASVEADVCIVGAGAAGITLARELAGREFRVCLLESGGLEFDEETQALYQGENTGRLYFPLDKYRLRYFGGTTNNWNGWCRPLDAIDFEARDGIPYSGWPFGKSHLDPFYRRAQTICQLGPFRYDVEFWEDATQAPRLPFVGERVMTKIFQFSPPTRFGIVYRDDIKNAENVTTYLYANVVDIETTETAQTVTRLRVATLEGKRFWVAAKLFILATGGIETPRLLMLSTKVQRVGLGNHHDLVGRFFMEHPHLQSGLFLRPTSNLTLSLYQQRLVKQTPIIGILTIAEDVLRREQLVNFSATLESMSTAELSPGVESARAISRAFRQRAKPDEFWRHVGNMIADIDDVAVYAYRKLSGQAHPPEVLVLFNRTEQAPNPDSRVTLAEERDRLGKRRVRLHWQLSPIDKRSLRRAHEIIGEELGRAGLGRLRVDLDEDDTTWPPLVEGGHHHIGTTRMHVDPKRGVVDENCRVHGISNLFIAGSSVFPTAGSANPMLTIVALAVRLADHVKQLMRP